MVLVMTGAVLTGVIVTVVFCVPQRSGDAPSQTCTATTQLAGGVGPVGVKLNTPVDAAMEPPQVCVSVTRLQVTPGPSGSVLAARYVYNVASVAVVGAVLVICGVSLTAVTLTVNWRVIRSQPPLAEPPSSNTPTVISALPDWLGCGV
jgi:hypothetical protein